jgi:hypothetical protein
MYRCSELSTISRPYFMPSCAIGLLQAVAKQGRRGVAVAGSGDGQHPERGRTGRTDGVAAVARLVALHQVPSFGVPAHALGHLRERRRVELWPRAGAAKLRVLLLLLVVVLLLLLLVVVLLLLLAGAAVGALPAGAPAIRRLHKAAPRRLRRGGGGRRRGRCADGAQAAGGGQAAVEAGGAAAARNAAAGDAHGGAP